MLTYSVFLNPNAMLNIKLKVLAPLAVHAWVDSGQ
jgi:hypothetical protein